MRACGLIVIDQLFHIRFVSLCPLFRISFIFADALLFSGCNCHCRLVSAQYRGLPVNGLQKVSCCKSQFQAVLFLPAARLQEFQRFCQEIPAKGTILLREVSAVEKKSLVVPKLSVLNLKKGWNLFTLRNSIDFSFSNLKRSTLGKIQFRSNNASVFLTITNGCPQKGAFCPLPSNADDYGQPLERYFI